MNVDSPMSPIEEFTKSPFGFMKSTVVSMKNIIEPIKVKWGEENDAEDTTLLFTSFPSGLD